MFLTKEEKQKIESKIEELEKESSGEIVVYCAKQSHSYFTTVYLAALIGMIGMSVFTLYEYYFSWEEFDRSDVLLSLIFIFSGGVVAGLMALFIPRLRVKLSSNDKIEELLLTKAKDVFLQNNLFETIDRTGVLIYISRLERRVLVFGDQGINNKIDEAEWDTLLKDVIEGIKTKNIGQGLINAVEDCKKILLNHGFEPRPDNVNELSNHVIVEED